MATTWTLLDAKLSLFLGDAGSASYPQALRIACLNWAQRILATHTAQEKSASLVLATGGLSAPLPADYFEIGSIYDSVDKEFLSPVTLQSGRADDTAGSACYWIWGDTLNLISAKTALTAYYYAYWPEIVAVTDPPQVPLPANVISIPVWAELPLVHLTAAGLLQPSAIRAAVINSGKIMIDNGNPLQNSFAQQAREHLWWYNELVGRYPPQSRLGGIV